MKRPMYKWLMVYLIVLFSLNTMPMHNENNYFHDHENIFNYNAVHSNDNYILDNNKKKSLTESSKSLYERLEQKINDNESNGFKKAFNNIDHLFSETKIQFRKTEANGRETKEQSSTLLNFLSQPHKTEDIIKIIELSIHKSLQPSETSLISDIKDISLPLVVRKLWEHNVISDHEAHAIISKNSVMNSTEIIRLIENGIAKTTTGYTVKIRTGSTYGDALKLFQDVQNIIHKLKTINHEECRDFSLDNYNNKTLNKNMIAILANDGLNAPDILSDAHLILEMRKHLLFVSRIGMPINFRPGWISFYPPSGSAPAAADRENYRRAVFMPGSLSATLVGNYYLNSIDASLTNHVMVNPLGINYFGSLSFDTQGADWWLSYSDGFLGGGTSYTVNFDQGTFWSNGQPSFMTIGFMAAGWRDYMIAGFSLSTVLSSSIGLGMNATMSISRAHDVSYLGQYPIDGKFAAIRGLHKIEINDSKGVQLNAALAINPQATAIPLNVAFRATVENTKRKIYRTHVPFKRVHRMMSEADIRGVLLLLGKEIKETRLPRFENPELMIDGDELVETKTGRLTGAFVIGVQSVVPIGAARIGGVIEIVAEFELGIRKFPNEKYEVSIEPRQVFEMGFFASLLNIFGAGIVKSMAIARKQIFMFDFMQTEAKKAYFDLIYHGRLPTSEEIEVYTEDRGPEYLLTEFRAQNNALRHRGIARTYLEKIRVDTIKKHIGFNAPLIPAILHLINKIDRKAKKTKERLNLKFEGIDREIFRSHAKSVATNGIISVKRQTFGGRRSEGQGFSGRYNQDLFVTHRRIHAIDDSSNDFSSNKWQFDSLIVHGQLEDTVITGNEENVMAEKINSLFGTFIGSFEYKNSKSPRTINIERELSKRDLHDLVKPEAKKRIPIASQATGIEQNKLTMLLHRLENKHPDHQGLIVKEFIEEGPGLAGFAAIHQLLGALVEHLTIRTESGYTNVVLKAKKFIATYSSTYPEDESPNISLAAVKTKKSRSICREFFVEASQILSEIDHQLRCLYDDKYLIDDNSPLVRIYGDEKIRDLVSAGIRQDKTAFKSSLISARKAVLQIINLEDPQFLLDERLLLYNLAGEKRLGLKENTMLLIDKYKNNKITSDMTELDLKNRFERCYKTIMKIDTAIEQHQNDKVMIIMDKEFVDETVKKLIELRKKVLDIIGLDHLSEDEKNQIKDKLEHENKFVSKLSRHRHQKHILIEGALAQALREPEKVANIDNHDNDVADNIHDSSRPKLRYATSRKRIYRHEE